MENRHQVYESKQLKGKIAVIFGVSGATGSQIAREFSKEAATVLGKLISGYGCRRRLKGTLHGRK